MILQSSTGNQEKSLFRTSHLILYGLSMAWTFAVHIFKLAGRKCTQNCVILVYMISHHCRTTQVKGFSAFPKDHPIIPCHVLSSMTIISHTFRIDFRHGVMIGVHSYPPGMKSLDAYRYNRSLVYDQFPAVDFDRKHVLPQ